MAQYLTARRTRVEQVYVRQLPWNHAKKQALAALSHPGRNPSLFLVSNERDSSPGFIAPAGRFLSGYGFPAGAEGFTHHGNQSDALLDCLLAPHLMVVLVHNFCHTDILQTFLQVLSHRMIGRIQNTMNALPYWTQAGRSCMNANQFIEKIRLNRFTDTIKRNLIQGTIKCCAASTEFDREDTIFF